MAGAVHGRNQRGGDEGHTLSGCRARLSRHTAPGRGVLLICCLFMKGYLEHFIVQAGSVLGGASAILYRMLKRGGELLYLSPFEDLFRNRFLKCR